MVEKNQSITAYVESVTGSGEGVIRHEGITFFVPACLPGEKVSFRVLKVKGGVGYGKVEEVFTPSEHRVRPKCPVFLKCGGCTLQHLSYEEQLKLKAKTVKDALKKIAGIDYEVPTAIASDAEYGYRNKLQLPIGVDREGNTVIGFVAERSHRISQIEECSSHPDWAKQLLAAVKTYSSACHVKGYNEETGSGVLRHIVAREIGGRFIFTLVVAKEKVTGLGYLIELLQKSFHEFSLYLNYHFEKTNVVFGERFELVHGIGFFEAEECSIRYEAGPVTFLQVNSGVRAKLYKAVVNQTVEDGNEVVIDAYSGGGLMTAMLAKKAKRAYGIELEREAVACADSLKAKNKLENVQNVCGKTEEELPGVLAKEAGEKLRLVLDPPRAGLHRSVVDAVIQSGVERVTIVSCNPATLARDLGLLTGTLIDRGGELIKAETPFGAYRIEKIQPYDMFPQTKHVETLVCLTRK